MTTLSPPPDKTRLEEASSSGKLPRLQAWPKGAWIGGLILGLLLILALGAPWLSPYSPEARIGQPFQAPSSEHWLGTNDIGQDILSELIWGTRISLLIGTLSALLISFSGLLIGLVAGYWGGWADTVLMRLADVVLVLPFLPLSILLAAYLGPNLWNLILVLTLLGWARPARVVRSQVLTIQALPYVEAARACGATATHILRRHVLKAVVPLVAVQWVQAASSAILVEASLAFLGLGDPTQKSWGTILYYAQARSAFLTGAWVWWVLPPGLMIALAVFGFALIGLAFDEIANPRLRNKK
jgi:ABC-type dipeptide/oligopeptide/nickel transport system permease subunit